MSRRALAAFLTVAALTLSACGDDAASTTSGPSANATSSTTAPDLSDDGVPADYNADVEQNFVTSCVDANSTLPQPEEGCQCIYDRISGPDGMAFEEFVAMEARIRDLVEGGGVPSAEAMAEISPELLAAMSDCLQ